MRGRRLAAVNAAAELSAEEARMKAELQALLGEVCAPAWPPGVCGAGGGWGGGVCTAPAHKRCRLCIPLPFILDF